MMLSRKDIMELERLENELMSINKATDEIMNVNTLSVQTKKCCLDELHIRALQIKHQIGEIKSNVETFNSTK